jgi:hypothetical protein
MCIKEWGTQYLCDNLCEIRVGYIEHWFDISHENQTNVSSKIITKVCTLPVHMKFAWPNLVFCVVFYRLTASEYLFGICKLVAYIFCTTL